MEYQCIRVPKKKTKLAGEKEGVEGGVVITQAKKKKKKAFVGEVRLHNHFSAFIWIICGAFRAGRQRHFHPSLFSISWRPWARRDEHLTSPLHMRACIPCYHSNVVIILGLHSFPSNECKSTPSPPASDAASINLDCTLFFLKKKKPF